MHPSIRKSTKVQTTSGSAAVDPLGCRRGGRHSAWVLVPQRERTRTQLVKMHSCSVPHHTHTPFVISEFLLHKSYINHLTQTHLKQESKIKTTAFYNTENSHVYPFPHFPPSWGTIFINLLLILPTSLLATEILISLPFLHKRYLAFST